MEVWLDLKSRFATEKYKNKSKNRIFEKLYFFLFSKNGGQKQYDTFFFSDCQEEHYRERE